MATDVFKYTHLHKLLCCGASWTSNEVKLALVTSSYTFDESNTLWSQVSTNEVATGSGYTTGGIIITGKTANNTLLDADDVVFTALTKTFRGGVLYFNGTIDTLVNPLISYMLFNTTPSDTTVDGVDFHILWNAGGILGL